jgi:hypothetical protein
MFMSKPQVKENEFSPAGGGATGTLNYQAPYGTHSSPEVSQNPAQFDSSNRNKAVGNTGNTRKNGPDRDSMKADINALYAGKKETPTPDEIITGIKFEMSQQIKQDKAMAKEAVLKNLKKDPKFYSGLKMMNITDDDMVKNMQEARHPNDAPARTKVTPNIEVTKQIFAEMSKGKDQKYVVNSGISDVMKQMWEAKKQRSSWKTGS